MTLKVRNLTTVKLIAEFLVQKFHKSHRESQMRRVLLQSLSCLHKNQTQILKKKMSGQLFRNSMLSYIMKSRSKWLLERQKEED